MPSVSLQDLVAKPRYHAPPAPRCSPASSSSKFTVAWGLLESYGVGFRCAGCRGQSDLGVACRLPPRHDSQAQGDSAPLAGNPNESKLSPTRRPARSGLAYSGPPLDVGVLRPPIGYVDQFWMANLVLVPPDGHPDYSKARST